jgi:glutaredoxin 3
MTSSVRIYTTTYCGYCLLAKALLTRRRVVYDEIDCTRDPSLRRWLVEQTGRRTVPQIFIDGRPIGGFTELAALDARGGLTALERAPAPSGEG